jgi:hypothetical protein
MKDKEINNPSAFPYVETIIQHRGEDGFPPIYKDITREGMTLRDYFAAKAMAAIMEKITISSTAPFSDRIHPETVANNAYRVADAMLRERSKGEE